MTNSAMQQLYQQIILDHAKARHGAAAEALPPLSQITDAAADDDPSAHAAADPATDPAADPSAHAAADPATDPAADPATHPVRVAESHQVNTTCGDEVTVRVGVRGAGDEAVIETFVWRGDGCSISMASASVLHDTVRGVTLGEARAVLDTYREMLRSRGTIEADEEVLGDAAAFSGVSRYPARVKCAMLAWVAFEAAVLPAAH